jgi:hypothetical protein
MCLSVSERLIHERGIVTDEKLFATTITPERSHFLETRRFFLALSPLYCHGLHLLNFSGSAQLGLLPLSPSAPLRGLAGHGRAQRRPTYLMRNHQTRLAPTPIATTMMVSFLSPWLTSWFQIFLHQRDLGRPLIKPRANLRAMREPFRHSGQAKSSIQALSRRRAPRCSPQSPAPSTVG